MKKRSFDESKHPRHPAGTSQGGEFRPAGGLWPNIRAGDTVQYHSSEGGLFSVKSAGRAEQIRSGHIRIATSGEPVFIRPQTKARIVPASTQATRVADPWKPLGPVQKRSIAHAMTRDFSRLAAGKPLGSKFKKRP